jgi:hypothetical protein
MFNNALLMAAASAAASVPGRYVVNYSCRFNSADSAYMQRTFGAGNDEKFTGGGLILPQKKCKYMHLYRAIQLA